MFNESMKFISIEHYTCFNLTTLLPLHTYKRVSNCSSSGFLNPDATPPSNGIIHGLKYDKNLSDSCPCISLCCTARPPRAASSSTVLMAAVPASSYMESHKVSKDNYFVRKILFHEFPNNYEPSNPRPFQNKKRLPNSSKYLPKRGQERKKLKPKRNIKQPSESTSFRKP